MSASLTKNNIFVRWYGQYVEQVNSSCVDARVKERRIKGLNEVFRTAVGYLFSGGMLPLVASIAHRKAHMILNAYSQKEIDGILQLSVSEDSKYYIAEEELMLMGLAQQKGNLSEEAQERFVSLYIKCFGVDSDGSV